jgi:hypothetical protein
VHVVVFLRVYSACCCVPMGGFTVNVIVFLWDYSVCCWGPMVLQCMLLCSYGFKLHVVVFNGFTVHAVVFLWV